MGRVFQPTYKKRMPDGTCRKVASKAWYAEWHTGGRTRRKKIGTKAAATSALAKFEEAAARRKHGLSDPSAEAAARARPLAEYLAEYLDVLRAKGTSADYRATTAAQLARTLSECKWHTWADITADALTVFLGRLRDAPQARRLRGIAKRHAGPLREAKAVRSGKGLGPATLNGYLRAAKAFARWAGERIDAPSPLARVKAFPEEVDVRRSRRILSDAELGELLTAAAATRRKGAAAVWGADRAMLYRVAAYTGLRAGELAELTPRHFALDEAPPAVTVEAKDAKGKRAEPVPLPDHLVALLRPWLARFPPAARLWPGNWAATRKQCQWLAADLRRAGVDARDAEGRPATFHSLKRRFVVRLIQAGAKVHEVRRMARHKDVATTLKHYVDENMKDLGALANKLPPV